MKIIGSDFDGTLNFGGIDDKKRQAISRWRAAGNLFVLVSGRHSANVRDLHIQQDFPCDYFIGSNGAVIRNDNNEVVHADCCDLEMLVPLIQCLLELGCPFALVHSAEDWFYVFKPEEPPFKEPACTLDTMPQVPYYTQVTTWMPTEEEAAAVVRKVRERFGDRFNPMQNGTSIDIVRADVNKATGLTHLLELVGANHEDMITVGDNTNDYHMIQAFRSYAMANGVPSIKELADFVTPGVAELIERELQEGN
jgi:Cof subfamily protein (haloacid dehalogenase superfamily)